MSKIEFESYMHYQVHFLKTHGLWDDEWLCENAPVIGFTLNLLYEARVGNIQLPGLIHK